MPNALDSIGPTPRNALMGTLADYLSRANAYAQRGDRSMPMGKSNPVLSLLANGIGLGDVAATADRASYGLPLTQGTGQAMQMLPETRNALMAVGPMAAKYPMAAGKAAMALGTGGADVAMGAERAAFTAVENGMMSSAMNTKQLRDDLLAKLSEAQAAEPYAYFGVRVLGPQQSKLNAGDIVPRSSKWVDGNPLTTKLPGAAVFELRNQYTESALNKALSYNLGSENQRIALVKAYDRAPSSMPEPWSAIFKSPEILHIYDRPAELSKITRHDELLRLLETYK